MRSAKEYMEDFNEKLNSDYFDKLEKSEREWLKGFVCSLYKKGVDDALFKVLQKDNFSHITNMILNEIEEELTNLLS